MSRPGDIGWTLTRFETDESGLKRIVSYPLPGDPRLLERAIDDLFVRLAVLADGRLPDEFIPLADALGEYRAGR